MADEVVIESEIVGFAEALTTAVNFSPLIAETVATSEGLVVSMATDIEASESVGLIENLEVGALVIQPTTPTSLAVSLPIGFDFTALDFNNFEVLPVTPGAVRPTVLAVEGAFDTFDSGSAAYALPMDSVAANFPSTARVELSRIGCTNALDFSGDLTLTTSNIGDFIELQSGRNQGVYKITGIAMTATTPPRLRAFVDRPLVLGDPANGLVDGLATVVATTLTSVTLRFDHPLVTISDPLVEVTFLENRTSGQFLNIFDILLDEDAVITFSDYRTAIITVDPVLFTAVAGDRVYVRARVSPKVTWQHISGVRDLTLTTTKLTLGAEYLLQIRNFVSQFSGASFSLDAAFLATPSTENRPKVVEAEFLPEDGTVVVTFDQAMRVDDLNLANPGDYTITGPTTVLVKKATLKDDRTVVLQTTGFGTGSYTLTVSTSTPKDVAGNPIDPLFNTAIFTAAVPETIRSVFTDKGPIAKPPLTLQSGSNAAFMTYNEVSLPGATLTLSSIGKYLTLSGGSLNGGTFRIASVITPTRARLANASFTLPDPDSGTLAWTIFDPRHGQIADDPADVVVRVNNVPVAAVAVIGLLGQVILPTTPAPADDVKIDYSWVSNPTVEVRRLNSKEFRLNAWNRNVGDVLDKSQHKYRYNNVLVMPESYDPENPSAVLEQPLLRELHYRAYERAYTAVLNDPTTLLLNSPIHKIAYPSNERLLSETFVAYEGVGLPESLITNPWTRQGTGTAVASVGKLTITDDSSGQFPTGKPIFWTRPIDVTFPHVFAMSWRFSLDVLTTPDGVWTGVAAGYSDDIVALVVGYLEVAGVKKIGILKRGFGDNHTTASAWTGGIDLLDVPTGAAADLDWTILHSFRIFRDTTGAIKVFLDGDVEEILRVSPDELPFLEELQGPFDTIQGAFFGSLSRPARSTSSWDFVRYLIQPTNPKQTAVSSFVSYEATVVPEADAKPWTPVGFHGTETIVSSDFLLLDSTSATDTPTSSEAGLVGGDYKGFVRFEPLLTAASEVVVDANVQLLTHTFGPSPYGLTLAVDDGARLMQIAFFPDRATPKFSYGGRSLPEDFAPYFWQTAGTATAAMQGRILRISDTSALDGRVYFIDDTSPALSDDRVVSASFDYMLEFRCRVVSYTADGSGYAGAFAQVYDSARAVGALFEELAGIKYVSFHSDGATLGPLARFAFNWGDGAFHTYRLVKSTGGDLVSLFIDGTFVGSFAYSSFSAPPPDPIGQVSFGSSTPASSAALSVVDWVYANAWRVRSDLKRFMGLWKGSDGDSLLGYHVPTKVTGRDATVNGNALGDGNAGFIAAGVVAGDKLIVDAGPNRGVYTVAGVGSPTTLTIVGTWPSSPSLVTYRIARETDWTIAHKIRLTRDSTGEVAILLDADTTPSIRVGYNSIDLPASGVGVIKTLADGLPTFAFGSFDAENIAQSRWDFVRYGMTRSVTEQGIAPHHQFLNQWNVMSSPERLFTLLPHELTSFKSSSTGIVPKKDPDFLADAGLPAWTQLNQDTPLVPRTQTWEVRGPFPVQEFVAGLNRPEDVLNNDGDFTLNDGTRRFGLLVPDDVLYTSLDVIEQTTGDTELLAPFDDECAVEISNLTYQKEVCLEYDGAVLPQNDPAATTPWVLVSDNPAEVSASAFAGILTYGTGGVGTKTVYRNDNALPDHPSLQTEASFRLRVLSDTSGGGGDTQIKFGLSAPGMTIALTFVTTPLGERLVLVLDQNNGNILGSVSFDFLDGAFHEYRIVRDPGAGVVRIFIDS